MSTRKISALHILDRKNLIEQITLERVSPLNNSAIVGCIVLLLAVPTEAFQCDSCGSGMIVFNLIRKY